MLSYPTFMQRAGCSVSRPCIWSFYGILLGFGMAYIFYRGFLKVPGTIGLLGASSAFHAIFNLLVSADGIWKWMGYLFPSVMIVLLIIGWHLLIKMNKYSM